MRVHAFQAKSLGEVESRILAQETLVRFLMSDQRIEHAYQEWRRTSGLAALVEQSQTTTDPAKRDTIRAELLLCFYGAGIALRRVILPATLAQFQLPYSWLPDRLAKEFMATIANEESPNSLHVITGVVMPPRSQRALGRRAKADGDSIRRDVEWFYRVRIQQPPEPIRSLARHHFPEKARKGDGRSIVQDGIKRAEELLNY